VIRFSTKSLVRQDQVQGIHSSSKCNNSSCHQSNLSSTIEETLDHHNRLSLNAKTQLVGAWTEEIKAETFSNGTRILKLIKSK